eukprot:1105612-Pyramimonas_sp.AAC.1
MRRDPPTPSARSPPPLGSPEPVALGAPLLFRAARGRVRPRPGVEGEVGGPPLDVPRGDARLGL